MWGSNYFDKGSIACVDLGRGGVDLKFRERRSLTKGGDEGRESLMGAGSRNKVEPWRREDLPSLLILHGTFALTGVGVILLGSLLPVLAVRWDIRDAHSGVFFAAQFSGSAVGSLLTMGRYRLVLMIGLALVGLAAALLPMAGATGALGLFFLLGLGLGSSMTATNLLVGERFRERRGAALSLLNFSWGVGAAVGPLAVARVLSLHTGLADGYELVFWGMAVCCGVALTAVFAGVSGVSSIARENDGHGRRSLGLVVFFAALAFLYVGIETTMGGWISAYSSRMPGVDLARAAAMGSFFWMALLGGRALGAFVLLRAPEKRIYPLAVVIALAGIAVIAGAHTLVGIAVGSCVVGVALGPVFPMNLALYLERAGTFSMAGTVLALSGFGGSVLPWLTGVVSSESGSLRSGFWVPAGAGLLILVMLVGLRVFDVRVRRAN